MKKEEAHTYSVGASFIIETITRGEWANVDCYQAYFSVTIA